MLDVSCDFETRSAVDLKPAGVYRYAIDPTTDVLCFSFIDPENGDILTWAPNLFYADPLAEQRLRELAADPDQLFRAWNAQFERIIWREVMVKRYGFPEIELGRWRDTAADAAANALPRKLDTAARVLGVAEQKDDVGHRLMLRMSKPRKVLDDGTLTWWEDPERMERLIAYNRQDVRTEMAVKSKVRDLPPYELRVYQLDQTINDRGVMLDLPLARAVQAMADRVQAFADAELREITRGQVTAVTDTNGLRAFVSATYQPIDSVAKDAIAALLQDPFLPDDVRRALELRAEAGKSSVKKVNAMFACYNPIDCRMRGILQYHGAGTGRWAGRLIQPQNFPARSKAVPGKFKAEFWRPHVLAGAYDLIDASYPPLEVLALMLRPCLRAAPGHKFIGADFNAIEARVTAWLAGEEWLLDAFRNGDDPYLAMAAEINSDRDMGKRVILGCGFGMGWAKFIQTCAKDGVVLDEDTAKRIISTYRDRNGKITELWRDLERAAVKAVQNPGMKVYAAGGKIIFTVRDDYLRMVLPNRQRTLAYYKPKIVERLTPWGSMQKTVRFWGENDKKQWVQIDAYGGLWTENGAQAIARDLMAEAMFRLEAAGYSTILSVHDEVLEEVPEDFGSVEEVEAILAEETAWSPGLPIKAEGWSGPAFRK